MLEIFELLKPIKREEHLDRDDENTFWGMMYDVTYHGGDLYKEDDEEI